MGKGKLKAEKNAFVDGMRQPEPLVILKGIIRGRQH